MMNESDIDFSWNYFAASHRKGIVGRIGGALKIIVWLEIIAGNYVHLLNISFNYAVEKKTISVIFVKHVQLDVTKWTLEKISPDNI